MSEKSFDFRIDTIEAGWLKAQLAIDGKTHHFNVSYLCEPLRSLLELVIDLNAYYDGCYTFSEGMEPEFDLIWQGESWRYSWVFKPLDDKEIKLRVSSCPDHLSEQRAPEEVMLETILSWSEFAGGVYREAERVLRQYGFSGYRQEWIQSDFPISDLLKLHYFLNNRELQWNSLQEEVGYLSRLSTLQNTSA